MNIINTDNLLATVLDSTNIEFVDDQVLALRKNTIFFILQDIFLNENWNKNKETAESPKEHWLDFLSLKEDKSYRKITEL